MFDIRHDLFLHSDDLIGHRACTLVFDQMKVQSSAFLFSTAGSETRQPTCS